MALHVGGFEDFIADIAKGMIRGGADYINQDEKKTADEKKKADDTKKSVSDVAKDAVKSTVTDATKAAVKKQVSTPMWLLVIVGILLLKGR